MNWNVRNARGATVSHPGDGDNVPVLDLASSGERDYSAGDGR